MTQKLDSYRRLGMFERVDKSLGSIILELPLTIYLGLRCTSEVRKDVAVKIAHVEPKLAMT